MRSFVRGQGCEQCHNTGFRGRTGIYELLVCDQEMRRLIAPEAAIGEMRQAQRSRGAKTLFDEALRLAENGETSLDEAMRVAFFE